MVFSTVIFLCVFLPIAIIGYYVLPQKLKNTYLLLCSLFFYAWGEPKYIFLMLSSIVCNYTFGLLIYRIASSGPMDAGKQKQRKAVVVLAVAINIGLLFVFKYLSLMTETLEMIMRRDLNIVQLALPIGISFYTFQGLSYVIDVYREEGKIQPDGQPASIVQKNPLRLALYISMFPQLIAGPIIRYGGIKDYLGRRKADAAMFAAGVERFIIGLAKKAVLANMIGKMADRIFSSEVQYMSASVAWLGAIAYTLQIYFDFSGYSDMAIGLGKIFGFKFMENFNYPYISGSIREFWRRWHISLSEWFRDYLYIPLGGSRKGNVYFHLFIVFCATGLWHGAEWGFLIWGLWHGVFVIGERLIAGIAAKRNKVLRIPAGVGWLYTMLVVVTGWVIFKLVNMEDAGRYLAVMFGIRQNDFIAYKVRFYMNNQMIVYMLIGIIACFPLKTIMKSVVGKLLKGRQISGSLAVGGTVIKRLLLLLLLFISFMFIINVTYNPFIYFRF